MEKAKVCVVVALSRNGRAIGNQGKLLWHIKDDLQHFKQLTLGHPVIMGRKTFESILQYIGGPLPDRANIVVTRDKTYTHEGVLVYHGIEEALEKAHELDSEEVHIGGGADMYAQALPFVDRLYLTLVDDEPEADTFFPDYSDFTNVIEKELREQNGLQYEWVTLERP